MNMANIGTNLSNAVNDIIKWLVAAIKKVVTLIHAGDPQNAALLLTDIQTTITAYLNVINQFVPTNPIKPFPKNFFSQLSWIFNNLPWLQIFMTLFTGTNPFETAKANALAVAIKWGFANEVY